ncbi:MAG: glutamine-hydrolyzing GMP synthase [Candidatus Heimdallarchaeum endolithica]|uniref:GMP synthase [glutamine-hydrolyzing] n=1 Tax=Candidatus Heimdallarchaeum endolithica TaxID=2876572 RepID=A0A9Y1FPK3_9ARCH|nr:MAG: glutamine-hydrolyzing GMP synthase [Candidatus Heimdallarchaeum endolithica]
MDKIGIFDFGGQYCHLIARRIRELGVYSEIIYKPSEEYVAYILSGGPGTLTDSESPKLPENFFEKINVPILGICYGHQMIAQSFGGEVGRGKEREYGKKIATIKTDSPLFKGLTNNEQVWMSHFDEIKKIPKGFEVIAQTDICKIAAFQNLERKIFGIQFHPEVKHTINGLKILDNFLDIVGCRRTYNLEDWVNKKITELKREIGDNKVIMACSGGVDSTVAAVLLAKAGINAHFIYVDTGLMRLNETEEVKGIFSELNIPNLHVINAEERFLTTLSGISVPEKKRKIIGHLFIEIFEEEAKKLGEFDYLGQGTIYPDRIESAQPSKHATVIKSHHNVGGLPEKMNLKLCEPLADLYKDEVRKVGKMLGLPEKFTGRHPFPGPALAIRILGEIDKEKIEILKKADAIVTNIIRNHGLYEQLWQVFPALIPVKSVGVMGDERTYEWMIAIRAVESIDAMTADWAKLPYDVLEEISNQIINKVKGVNRVLFDITSKPPGTIEYE